MLATVKAAPSADSSDTSLPRRITLLITGWALIAIGISGILHANLGAGPFDVLNTALASRLNIAVGTASWITISGVLVLAMCIGARPGIATFAGAFVIGQGVNTLLPYMPQPSAVLVRSMMLASALLVLCVGISLVLLSNLGGGAIDLLMLALHRRGLPIVAARLAIEVTAASVGYLLGGSAGIGTVIIAFCVGPAIQRSLRWLTPAVAPFVA
jgi:uncharacterized membrane protein YczE